jgi:hypothetical protein
MRWSPFRGDVSDDRDCQERVCLTAATRSLTWELYCVIDKAICLNNRHVTALGSASGAEGLAAEAKNNSNLRSSISRFLGTLPYL